MLVFGASPAAAPFPFAGFAVMTLHSRRSASMLLPPRDRRLSAFTLIELLTVMAVITILVAIATGGIRGARERAAIGRAKSELALVAQALEDYKRHYGDYPETGSAGQATPVVTSTIGVAQAQSLLFNALTGVYGPTNFTTRLNGPVLLDVSKVTVEVALNNTTFAVPVGSPPAKTAVANALLDPWGNRYLYYYKAAPAAGRPPTNTWRAPAYVLYSAGPDGLHTPPPTGTGLFSGTTQTSGTGNADNLYADKLP